MNNGYQGQVVLQNTTNSLVQNVSVTAAIQNDVIGNHFNSIIRLGINLDPKYDINKQFSFKIGLKNMILGEKTYMYQIQDVAIPENQTIYVNIPPKAAVIIDYVVDIGEQ